MAVVASKLEKDILNLARIALSGRTQDVMQMVHRMAKAHRENAPELATGLVDLMREAPTRASPLRRQTEAVLPTDADTRFSLLRIEETPTLDHEPIFAAELGKSLYRIVEERTHLEALLTAGLEPTRSAIFTGPPGVGKTMAARWVARSLNRPLLILDLAAVMSSYLGRTGTNLRHVLDYAKSMQCVLLLDELDAIAKRRDDRSEVGELKRLVTVLIQEIDDWPATGLLLAATNHSELLDPAIWRRFDHAVEFPMPDLQAIKAFVKAALTSHMEKSDEWAGIMAGAMLGKSFSDIDRDLKSARRLAAIHGGDLATYLKDFIRPDQMPKPERITLARTLAGEKLMSQRAAHEFTGVARETIRGEPSKPRAKPGRKRKQDGEAQLPFGQR
ncbi:AAA family ATPase [Rhizobium johnstonii]|uniref:AAA family ATPase n=1 Tax=Rhizobium johnstonii TaxID=3019933 RepID=UPI003F982D2F